MQYSEIMVRYGEIPPRGQEPHALYQLNSNAMTRPFCQSTPQVHVNADRDRTHMSIAWNRLSACR